MINRVMERVGDFPQYLTIFLTVRKEWKVGAKIFAK
jgi:hypothetical protein